MFCEDPPGSVQFYEATHLTAFDWDQLQHTVGHRVLRYFHRHGLLERYVTEDMRTWQASGSSESGPVGASRCPESCSKRLRGLCGVLG